MKYKSILQTPEWAELKKKQGFIIHRIGELFVHQRRLPMGKSFLYLPEIWTEDLNNFTIAAVDKLAQENGAIFAKFEFLDRFCHSELVSESDGILQQVQDDLSKRGLIPSFEQVQPQWRQIVNIAGSEEEVLAQMHQKGRYNIRVAKRHGVEIQNLSAVISSGARDPIANTESGGISPPRPWGRNDSAAISQFYNLYQETVQREGFAGRNQQYFQNMVDILGEKGYVGIFIASYQNQPRAAALVTFCDGVATYLYGGSSSEDRNTMAPYLLHWEIIREAKERGCHSYDLGGRSPVEENPKFDIRHRYSGVPLKRENPKQILLNTVISSEARDPIKSNKGVGISPPWSRGRNDNIVILNSKFHRWQGITQFKEKFGGKAIKILGAYDKIYQPRWYRVYRILETKRRKVT